jgi:hypothetical protein
MTMCPILAKEEHIWHSVFSTTFYHLEGNGGKITQGTQVYSYGHVPKSVEISHGKYTTNQKVKTDRITPNKLTEPLLIN